ncbi:MAG: beta-lactamase family protein, partial [Acidobacteriota bacterium]|nr:beta-lactamase family protein [Acidobacteriota bacterium]
PPPSGNNRNCRIAGGLYGTLDDYGRFLQMQLAGGSFAGKRILSRESTLLMRTDQVHAAAIAYSPFKMAFPDEPTRYGFGTWLNSVDGHGVGISVSDGGAYGTRPWIDFDRDLIAVFFTQTPLRGIFRLVEKDVPNAVRAAIDRTAIDRADIDRAGIDKVKP